MINPWYVILKSRYDAKAINETYVQSFVVKGKITQAECDAIVAQP
jgi:hypothetical protein